MLPHPFSHSAPDLASLKQRLPLLDFLRQLDWQPHPIGRSGEFVGLCPLRRETRPSFYVNARKNLFFCHGCGRGGDLIRFLQLFRNLSFSQAVSCLQLQLASPPPHDLLEAATHFYRFELHRHPEAAHYLASRGLYDPALINELGIGYAPGGNLRRHLVSQGYTLDPLLAAGLINPQGRDTFSRRIIFPCQQQDQIVNLYGRSIGAAFPHRLLPRSKGGLFAWNSVQHFSTLILVEGLFDLAVLWQAGFRSTTCVIGTHLTAAAFEQLHQSPNRTVYIAFDQDENRAGQHAALQLAGRLQAVGIPAPIVHLPQGHDPNSYFLAGATAADFARLLDRAQCS
jgi:DNA primase